MPMVDFQPTILDLIMQWLSARTLASKVEREMRTPGIQNQIKIHRGRTRQSKAGGRETSQREGRVAGKKGGQEVCWRGRGQTHKVGIQIKVRMYLIPPRSLAL